MLHILGYRYCMLLVDLLVLILVRNLRRSRPFGNHLRSWYVLFVFVLLLI
jgi:hypothetical protein